MSVYGRAVRGAEAGAITAVAVEVSFFVLDLIRLHPLATPGALSGASLGPGGFALDLTSLTGVIAALWATYQILLLTFSHVLTFAVVGVAASLMFDWTAPLRADRLLVVAALCAAGLFGTVAITSSLGALEAVGTPLIVAMNVLAALILAWSLRLVSKEEAEQDARAPSPTA
jgi:hypothetical protein